MHHRPIATLLALSAMLSACGGGGSSGSVGGSTPTPTPSSTPTPTAAGCSLRERQDWAAAQLREWYLFPETLPTSLNPASYASVDTYIDALTATARSQRRDRYFTYLTSIAEEDAYYQSGSSAGYGFRLGLDASRRLFITEAFENSPAQAANVGRGAEIVAIGTTTSNLRTVSAIVAAEGTAGLIDALGPDTVGTSRVLQLGGAGGNRIVTIAKADFDLQPVSSIYGAKVINDGGRKVGYVNLRTFISTADPQLRAAFAQFRAQGVTDIIVDVRYNGGGLVSIAELFGDLLGRNRSTSDVLSYTSFRSEKSSNNRTRNYTSQAESVGVTRIAFIGTGGTASASELVINSTIPYLHANAGLIGTNTYGKPVGQIAIDRVTCDDRLRVIAFATQNAARQGDYFNGLAGTVEASCQAPDDIGHQLGDPLEASTRQALDFLAGRSCTPISPAAVSASGQRTQAQAQRQAWESERELLSPTRPSTAQREVPGLF
ncbi:S41 family peptidase [Sphingomonas sp. ERG5]|uniref:S41 family peptidase n=1 Tax=Sphingomonas sp. ERG5 TaxID=1381597 RepID=UPI0009DDF78B|nr:S41 family peptidase [Sphingomonas sp. ERG5]